MVFLVPQELTMDRSLSVITAKGIFRKTVLNIDKPHPLWPQDNGEIERQNRTTLKRLRIAAEGRD